MVVKLLSNLIKHYKRIVYSERGLALTEALVTIGITGIVAVAFLSSISNTSQAVMTSQELVTAENLAKSQMEYIKSQVYCEDTPVLYDELSASDIPENYDIVISGNQIDGHDGLQKIIVTVTYNGVEAFHLENYRARRD